MSIATEMSPKIYLESFLLRKQLQWKTPHPIKPHWTHFRVDGVDVKLVLKSHVRNLTVGFNCSKIIKEFKENTARNITFEASSYDSIEVNKYLTQYLILGGRTVANGQHHIINQPVCSNSKLKAYNPIWASKTSF